MDLRDFLLLPSHRFRWGGAGPWADDATRGDDCMTFPASWVMAAIGIDPARKHRGTYRDRVGAGLLVDKFGGPLAFFAHHLEAIGAVRVTDLRDGDVGLVHMLAGDDIHDISERLVGAIRFGPMWAAISPGGVVMRRARHERAWRLPNWG